MKLFIFAITVLFGIQSFAQTETVRTAVIRNITANVILKTYQDFKQDSHDLKAAVELLIQQPTQSHLESAQAAWRKARGSYEISEGFLFGPIDSLSIDPLIDTWPLSLKELRDVLKSEIPLDLDSVRGFGSNLQGFHAIEFLLFGDGIITNTKDVRSFDARQFSYLSAATILLVEQVDLLVYAWVQHHDPEDTTSPAYIDIIGKPGSPESSYSTEVAVIEELSNGIIAILNEASRAKLPDAAGDDIENANAKLEESPFSWNSINDYVSNIDSVFNIYTGSYKGHQGWGLKDLVATTDPVLAQDIEVQIRHCRQLILDIRGSENMSFGQAIKSKEGRVRIFAAIAGLQKLQASLEEQVVPLLK